MRDYVGAIDQGTTSTRFVILDRQGRLVSMDQQEHRQSYPKPGWVEHDPMEIWQRTVSVIGNAMAQASLTAADLAAVGVANQRETTVLWDRTTGEPVGRTPAPTPFAENSPGMREPIGSGTRPACRWPRTSQGLRPAGCSTMWKACGSGPRQGMCCSAPSTPG